MFIVLFTSFSRRRASKKQKVPFSSRGGHPSWLERFLHGSSSQRGNGQTPTNGGVQSYGEQGYGGGQSDRESQSYGGGQNYQ